LDFMKMKGVMSRLINEVEAYSLNDELEQLEDCYNEFTKTIG